VPLLACTISAPALAQRDAPVRAKSASSSAAGQSAAARSVAVEIREQAGGRIKRFYSERGFWPLWAANGRIGPEAGALLNFLESADLDGLDPDDYKIDDVRTALNNARPGDAASIARAELQLSRAFAAYVEDMRSNPKVGMIYLDKSLEPRKLRADTVLRAASMAPAFGTYISTMGWMSPHYTRIRKLVERARDRGMSGEQLRRIRLNLDRARILPGAGMQHIVVDAASGRLWYYKDGRQGGTMRVVVGTPETPTPMLAGVLHYAILNPYWNIPVDLAQRNIAPKVLGGRSLRAMRMEALSDWSARPAKLDPATINWQAVADGTQQVRLRQLPGRANSMGKVKFMFPNEEGIYLHDTPDRALFTKANRHFSNGCIRLENAAGLGNWLFASKMSTKSRDPEQLRALPMPVPIYLTYLTVTENKSGIQFLSDVYGRDRPKDD
jgi:L,D-transpeptidase YcbB